MAILSFIAAVFICRHWISANMQRYTNLMPTPIKIYSTNLHSWIFPLIYNYFVISFYAFDFVCICVYVIDVFFLLTIFLYTYNIFGFGPFNLWRFIYTEHNFYFRAFFLCPVVFDEIQITKLHWLFCVFDLSLSINSTDRKNN